MAYATLNDLVARYGERELIQLTDLVNMPPSAIDADRVQIALDDASAVVDSYVGQVYALPLQGCAKPVTVPGADPEYMAPPQLVRITCDLARFNLYDDLAPESEVASRQKAALKELDSLAQGKTVLSCPWGGQPGTPLVSNAQTGGEDVAYSFSCRSITDETMRGY